jgi:hypothetical protein
MDKRGAIINDKDAPVDTPNNGLPYAFSGFLAGMGPPKLKAAPK